LWPKTYLLPRPDFLCTGSGAQGGASIEVKPVFANTFNVTHNKSRSEIAISFAHIYTEHNFAIRDGALTDVSAKVADEVGSVLVNKEGAIALAKLLNRVVSDWGVDVDE
jgi:hypothetical protein